MTDSVIDQEIYQALVEAVGDDFVGEMIDAYLEEGVKFLASLKSALADGDVDRFRRATHSLKSNSATFGALQLSGLAKELEDLARENRLDEAGGKLEPVFVSFSEVEQALKEFQHGRA